MICNKLLKNTSLSYLKLSNRAVYNSKRLLSIRTETIPQSNESSRDKDLRLGFDSPNLWAQRLQKPTPNAPNVGLLSKQFLQEPSGFINWSNYTIERAVILVEKICQPNAPHSEKLKIVKRLDQLSDILCSIIDVAELVRSLHPNQKFLNYANKAYLEVVSFMNELNTHPGLYYILKNLLNDREIVSKMSPEELSVANLFLIDFEKSGIHLDESSRKRFVDLNDEINQLGREFLSDTGSLEASIQVDRSELRGCDGWWNGTQQVQFIPTTPYYSSLLLRTAHDANLRKKMYTASNKPTEKQVEVLEEMLIKRAELANLLGKRSFGDLFLEDKMAQTPENVSTFLSSLVKKNLPKVSGEMELLQKLKQLNERDPNIMGWDQQYYIYLFEAQLRQSHRQIYKKLSQYFSVGTVIKGLSNILETMYQLRFRLVDSVNYSELWDPSVRKVEVLDNNDEIVGIIYFDLFGRPNKPGIAAHYTLQCSRRIDDDDNNGINFNSKVLENPVMGPIYTSSSGKAYQIPVVVLSCCFNHPLNGTPTLLSMNEVETLFHEMGHAIHSMVARTDYHNVAGTRCKIDFVELPSIFMETLGTSSTIIPFYAKHHATLDPIPEALIQDYKKLSNQFNILETQHQILLSSIDQAYHSIDLSNPPAKNFSYDIIEQKQNSWGTYPYVKGTHLGIKFGHLFSYSATYYSYLLGRCFANKIWEKGFKGHDLRSDIGEVFRNEVLAPGGSRDPWLSISNCLYKFELVNSEGKGVSKENEVLLDKLSKGNGKSMEIVGEWGLGSTRTFH